MKNSVEWHKNCLKNIKKYREKLLKRIEDLKEDLEKTNREIFIYEQQIIRAEKLNKKEFDSDRFKA
jgi:mRNA-degrading endonuclease RelE of RelBE toxin-antitoxin system